MRIAAVVLDKAAPAYDREYDYLLPQQTAGTAGCRVLVPFGAGNRPRLGMILSVRDADGAPDGCKTVLRLLDAAPLLDDEALSLLRMLRATTLCCWYDAVRTLIPPGAGLRLSTGLTARRGLETDPLSPAAARLYSHLLNQKRIADEAKALAAVGLESGHPAAEELIAGGFAVREQLVKKRIVDERAVMARLIERDLPVKLTPKQKLVYELLLQVGCGSVKELCYFTGVTRAVIDRMRRQGLLELFEEIVPRTHAASAAASGSPAEICLSDEQQRAFDLLSQQEGFCVSLLHGVTGSGKTQVFLKLIEYTLAAGKTAMVLIPEISLTPQTAALFSARFGERVAVLHSSLSMTERLDEWERIRAGGAPIVVGTRSAVFAPLKNIGLIVIDEEQEHTYHSESAPRYHAREVAKYRAKTSGAQLLLCSATPSVESYYHAKSGRYRLIELKNRYRSNPLPEVFTLDMRTEPMAAGSLCLSQRLGEEIDHNLSRGEQSILLLNRRGYNTLVRCSSCGETARCPNCSIPLVYHTANDRLQCHYCGHAEPQRAECPVCRGTMLRYAGVGTQRAEQELSALFPNARILRMDADTTMSRFAHEKGFSAFSRGEYDILIGTQMVAKGLDFPQVTLVGILAADQSLYSDDFRGFERTFSLITQVVGRSGRASLPGRAFIQTFSPDNRILAFAAAQDYRAFYDEEIRYRKLGLYPPFCALVGVLISGEQEEKVLEDAKRCLDILTDAAKTRPDVPMRVLGPAQASPYRAAGRYRMRLLIKCRGDRAARELLSAVSAAYYSEKRSSALVIDMQADSI